MQWLSVTVEQIFLKLPAETKRKNSFSYVDPETRNPAETQLGGSCSKSLEIVLKV